jgi:hypothetical protein
MIPGSPREAIAGCPAAELSAGGSAPSRFRTQWLVFSAVRAARTSKSGCDGVPTSADAVWVICGTVTPPRRRRSTTCDAASKGSADWRERQKRDFSITGRGLVHVVDGDPPLSPTPKTVVLGTGGFRTDKTTCESSRAERDTGMRQNVVVPGRMPPATVVRCHQDDAVSVGEIDQRSDPLDSRFGPGMGKQYETRPGAYGTHPSAGPPHEDGIEPRRDVPEIPLPAGCHRKLRNGTFHQTGAVADRIHSGDRHHAIVTTPTSPTSMSDRKPRPSSWVGAQTLNRNSTTPPSGGDQAHRPIEGKTSARSPRKVPFTRSMTSK